MRARYDHAVRQADVKRRTKWFFDRLARRYERSGPISSLLGHVQRRAIDALRLVPSDRFLDVGCGPGRAVRDSADLVERAVGVDLSDSMIREARALAGNDSTVEFYQADAENLPFENGEFTAVLCSTSFHHYPDPAKAIAECARVLEPGGRFVIADGSADRFMVRALNPLFRLFEPGYVGFYRESDLTGFGAKVGLSLTRSEKLIAGVYAIALMTKKG